MTLVHFYYDPVSEFNRLFEDALAARLRHPWTSTTEPNHTAPKRHEIYRPKLDIYESKDTNTVSATFELPGLTSDDVTVDVHRDRLIVSGEFPTSDSIEEGTTFVVRERRSGKFSRTLQLPPGTKSEDVNARMESGVLTIAFPKTSPEQEPKRIAVL